MIREADVDGDGQINYEGASGALTFSSACTQRRDYICRVREGESCTLDLYYGDTDLHADDALEVDRGRCCRIRASRAEDVYLGLSACRCTLSGNHKVPFVPMPGEEARFGRG
jgi:hypothetical protein